MFPQLLREADSHRQLLGTVEIECLELVRVPASGLAGCI